MRVRDIPSVVADGSLDTELRLQTKPSVFGDLTWFTVSPELVQAMVYRYLCIHGVPNIFLIFVISLGYRVHLQLFHTHVNIKKIAYNRPAELKLMLFRGSRT